MFYKSLRAKVALLFIIVLFLTEIILFTTSYLFLKSSLKRDEHKEISFLLLNFWAEYQAGGVELLSKEIQINRYTEKAFLVRLADKDNQTMMLVVPNTWEGYNFSQLSTLFPRINDGTKTFYAGDKRKKFIVGSVYLPDGNILQVGLSTKSNDIVLNHFKNLFLLSGLPVLFISILISLIFSNRLLIPINRLINAATEIIKTGNTKTRISSTNKKDEVSKLINLFNTMLGRLDSYIDTMREALDNVAHDLRTPMTRLKNSAELAIRSNDPTVYREALNDCIENSNSILTMLNTLMDISEAETGVIRLDKQEINLTEVLLDLAELYSYVAEDKGIRIINEVEENLIVRADINRIRQVFANILDNAVKYTPEGGEITIKGYKTTNEKRQKRLGCSITVKISDTGIGIPKNELEQIWHRLYRGRNVKSKRGLGLGLSLVRAIIKAHKGEISVSSQEGKGSVFITILPC